MASLSRWLACLRVISRAAPSNVFFLQNFFSRCFFLYVRNFASQSGSKTVSIGCCHMLQLLPFMFPRNENFPHTKNNFREMPKNSKKAIFSSLLLAINFTFLRKLFAQSTILSFASIALLKLVEKIICYSSLKETLTKRLFFSRPEDYHFLSTRFKK